MKLKTVIVSVFVCLILPFSNSVSVDSQDIFGETLEENEFADTTTSDATTVEPLPTTILETLEDAIIDESKWTLSEFSSKFLEYHHNSSSLKGQENDTNSCASTVSSDISSLRHADGIWSSCYDDSSTGLDASSATHPSIHYFSPEELLVSITINFYMEGFTILRLHVGNECLDHSVQPNSNSPCKYIRVIEGGVYWQGWHWRNTAGEKLTEFRVELVSNRTDDDVILLDRITVEYAPCKAEDKCPVITTTPYDDAESGNARPNSCPIFLLNLIFFLFLLHNVFP